MNKYPIFSKFGIELEYMIVDKHTLNVSPIADELIFKVAGEYTDEVLFADIAWNNELALHVIELKTNGPVDSLDNLAAYFADHINNINQILAEYNACLMPTAMHPWMNPLSDTKLWPHDDNVIYQTFDKIFNSLSHGWLNLQSIHLNLPFANDDEFEHLHTAIRAILPILPALSNSSPFKEGKKTNSLGNRLHAYALNQKNIPQIAGDLIPELVSSEAEYQRIILQPSYQAIAPYDSEKILQHEWLNSRLAIARFDRSAIEIRILDIQECPQADIAICDIVSKIIKALVEQQWCKFDNLKILTQTQLVKLLWQTNDLGMDTIIEDLTYLSIFGLNKPLSARQLWQYLTKQLINNSSSATVLSNIIKYGNLAERIIIACDGDYSLRQQQKIYQQLCQCLKNNALFG